MRKWFLLAIFSLVCLNLMTPVVAAAPDFDKIKTNVEQSAQKRKEFRENGGEVGLQPINQFDNQESAATDLKAPGSVPEKVEIKVLWTMLGGHIKYWRVGNQYYLHLG